MSWLLGQFQPRRLPDSNLAVIVEMEDIHSTAVVDKNAIIGEGSSVGAYSVIGPNVVIGKNTRVASHVVIEGHTTIGDNNQIFQFASIGSAPQDLKFSGEASKLTIGKQNVIREYVTIQPGTAGGGMLTTVGSNNLFMAGSHVGHDGKVGDGNIFANTAALAGHVEVGNYITIGGMVGVHQYARLGDLSIAGAGSMITKDLPPFCIAQGDRARLVGINKIGLERKGYSSDEILLLKRLFRSVFSGSGGFSERIKLARENAGDSALADQFCEFMLASRRGVTFPKGAKA